MLRMLVVLGILVMGAAAVGAEPPAVCAPPRRALIPGRWETVTRVVKVPACLEERRVPVYSVIEEPILGCRTVPQYGAVKVPVQGTRAEPVYEIRRTPICGVADETVYAQVCRPVMGLDLTSWCVEKQVPWFSVTEEVPCGTRRVQRVLGYREEKVQVGTALKACQTGWRIEKRFLGYGQEQVVLGTREVRRITAYRDEMVVVRPARTETVNERFQRPARWVTVSDARPRPLPLASTEEVLTEAQFRAALAPAPTR